MRMHVQRGLLGLAILWWTLGPAQPAQGADSFASVYLSEFLADNQQGLRDDDGEPSAWIELHNASANTISLKGWFLTDTTNRLTQWRFPRVSVLPDKYLVVFASGKTRTNDLAHLHASFRLNRAGGYLALVNPATNIVSEFAAYPAQSADVSYGRVRGEPALRGFLRRPTPGRPNLASGPDFAPAITFSRPSGSFTLPFTLQLSPRSPAAVLRYTLDGTLPNRGSPLYENPLLITNTTQVRVRAYQDGLLPGPPASETYVLIHSNLVGFTSTLPVLVMHTLGRDRPTSARSSAVHFSLFEPLEGRTSLTNPPTLTTRGGFHTRGSSSSGLPQPGYSVQFVDEFNQERAHPLLGMPADSDWVLYAPNGFEPVLIHNPFVHQLSRDLGRYSARTRFLEAYLVTSPGPVAARHYQGIYVLEEKIKVGKHRVDIAKLGPEDLRPPAVTGGYLLKIDRAGPGEGGFSGAGVSMVYVEPKEQVISLPQRAPQEQYLNSFFDDFDRALHGSKWKDPLVGYRAFIDVDSWIDFHVLEVLSGNVDTLVLSTYFHKPRNGKIVFGPHWDFDRALGSTDGRDDDPRRWSTGRFFDAPWWNKLFHDPDFWQQWVDRWQELRQTHFSLPNLESLIDDLTDELREAQPRQARKWGLQPRGGTYQSEINLMKHWLSNRIDFIDHELVPPPRLNRAGGPVPPGFQLILTASTNATVYYTLDGSDPRLPQGAISSNALVYAAPLPLGSNLQLTARAHNPKRRQTDGPPTSTPWSGPLTAHFTLAPR